MDQNSESLFEKAMARYEAGEHASELIKDFESITNLLKSHFSLQEMLRMTFRTILQTF